ncbi:uncharacterized protein DDB_G0271670-like [Phymastichus coffea]|uniref:uncharacterized protein DDB_G0271670-like n=1 Tax=Phymastichus coffea TaxID=108790 RepID=UPI00273BAD87|nr:uncharacterized protein DDB_G0271670-like [Phymastichus coffea]
MADSPPKIEFALGSEVSPGHFFKSSFARRFADGVGGSRLADTKSLDYDLANATIAEEPPCSPSQLNNFHSLVNFDKEIERPDSSAWAANNAKSSSIGIVEVTTAEQIELERLRKKCQVLKEDNERLLTAAVALSKPTEHTKAIDNVYLQNQVTTLQWQLKQSETNRQMLRSVMEQVVRFLDRVRKSLDIMHERSNAKPTGRNSTKDKLRVPRSRSVNTVHVDSAGASSCASSTTSSSSSSSASSTSSSSSTSSHFGRAKSVAQISSNNGSSKDLTWTVVVGRKSDLGQCTTPRTNGPSTQQVAAVSAQDVSKGQEKAFYRRPKQMEVDIDDKPPEKLSQEAFRLMRTVQSLLVMREPDLARVNVQQDSALFDQQPDATSLLSLPANFVNSTALHDGGGGAVAIDESMISRKGSVNGSSKTSSQTTLVPISPAVRRQSIASACAKNAEDEDRASLIDLAKQENGEQGLQSNGYCHALPLSSTPNAQRIKKHDGKDLHGKLLRDLALNSSNEKVTTSRPKTSTSVCSAEGESGFSSLSSFQEVGLPQIPVPNTPPPIKGGCHTEVGLPEVPIETVRHRRWSSTPAECHALLKRLSGSFANGTPNGTKSYSVWV